MQGPDIFISYCRGDAGTARVFAEALTQEGFRVWWDAALRSGETFDEVIEKALRSAKAVVVLWSPRSVVSRWVRAEATLADRNGTLAPAIIEPCERPIIFELTHTVDLSDWTGDTTDGAWQTYVEDLRGLVERRKSAETPDSSSDSAAPPASGGSPAASERPMTSRSSKAIGDLLFARNKMDNLISALSSLHEAMTKTNGTAGIPSDDDGERTQIYTRSDEYDYFQSDELHCLELSNGEILEKRYVVSPLGLKIGRTAPADIILADAKVSRAHCKVELKDNELYVSDLTSTNGTFVDGERIGEVTVLPVGSILRIGNFSLVHELRTRAEV